MRGCFRSSSEAERISDAIDRAIKEEAKKKNILTLLILGAGESGKSTIFKQFKILHQNGFNVEESEAYKDNIRVNVLQAIIPLVKAALGAPLSSSSEDAEPNGAALTIDPSLQVYADEVASFNEYTTNLTPGLAHKISLLWKDPAVRHTFEHKTDIQIQSNAKLLLDSVERIAAADYLPTENDILCSRVRTTGIVELKFNVERTQFKIVDVGGQRCERKKWWNCFDGVSALLYVVALDEYDLTLFEDDTTNRMLEALHLFEDMCNHPVFVPIPLILFLNKKDILREKIERVNLSDYFPEYKGGGNYKAACEFLRNKYLGLNKTDKVVYTHYTCATSTKNIRKVFEDIRHSILLGAVGDIL